MHNLVHDYLNGTMSDVTTAANDPLFMVHHSSIDKLLEVWLHHHRHVRYPESDEIHPAQRRDAFMAPYFPLRENGWYWDKDIRSLGYSYVEFGSLQPDEDESLWQRMWQWMWEQKVALGPVLGVSGVVLLCICICIWAAIKCKGKRRETQDVPTGEELLELKPSGSRGK